MTMLPLLAVLALGQALSQDEHAGAAGGPRAGRSVLLYLIDTCRADHLSVYGYPRPTTPFLEKLAARGVVFESCTSQGPWTKPALAALPEVLATAGFATAGFSANPLMGELSNYTQGFDSFVGRASSTGATRSGSRAAPPRS